MTHSRLQSILSIHLARAEALCARLKWLKWVGVGLIVLSFILYGGLLLVPMLALAIEAKVGLSTALVVVGEITYWIGVVIVGRELVSRYRDRLHPRQWLARLFGPPSEKAETCEKRG
jgi:hypothetical protein